MYHRILHRGRISATVAMCSDGVIALEGPYNGDKFTEFITGTVIPQMFQSDSNNSRSVLVVMDNCNSLCISSTEIMKDAGHVSTTL